MAAALLILLAIFVLLAPRPAAAASPDVGPDQTSPAPYAEASEGPWAWNGPDESDGGGPWAIAPEPTPQADPATDLERLLAREAPGSSIHVVDRGWVLLVQGQAPTAEAEARIRAIAAKSAARVEFDLAIRPPQVGLRVRLIELPTGVLPAADATGGATPIGAEALASARVGAEESTTVRSGGQVRIHLDHVARGASGIVAVRAVFLAENKVRLEVDDPRQVHAAVRGQAKQAVDIAPGSTLLLRHLASSEHPRPLARAAGFLRRPLSHGPTASAGREIDLLIQPSLPEFGGSQAPSSPTRVVVADLAPPPSAPARSRVFAAAAPFKRLVALTLRPAVSAVRFLKHGRVSPDQDGAIREAALAPLPHPAP